MSFPRRWESRINISWIPFFKGMTRGKAVIPTKVGIQNKYLLDPLFQGDDKGELRPRAPNHPPGSPFSRG
ncbi:MAG: hypothetical protein SFT68_01915 [Rickettsiaceae bacterium]|nr:hypothetical protein [Rickettsiaceae bacterium]